MMNLILKTSAALVVALTLPLCVAANDARWEIQKDGSIAWTDFSARDLPHNDHIEASGEQVSTVLRYGVGETGAFSLSRSVVWPMLRTIPNNTHASLTLRFDVDLATLVSVDGAKLANEKVEKIQLDGFLTVTSRFDAAGKEGALQFERKIFPSTSKPFVCERVTLKNVSDAPFDVVVDDYRRVTNTLADKGVNGSYTLVENLYGAASKRLAPDEELRVDFAVQGYSDGKGEEELTPDFDAEEAARRAFVDEMWNSLVLETPEPILDRTFAFAKIRACESIYRTKGGLMHGPGGESYYAAIWANDQAEYANPFFPFVGYKTGVESALNSYLHFARFMNDEFKPIPSSIIAEGIDIWNGAGDRGDAAMIAHGAARYALARADRDEARQLWPLIEWCLEYCKRKLNDAGVVASRCDELEGRFPAGDANLCTSTLYYDALLSAQRLGGELGVDPEQLARYASEAATLRENIEKHFGATVRGYEAYRYYEGCEKLRSWICMPLVVGISDRAEGTIAALFSERLWTENGLLSEEGSKTFWDRSTLYALRGVFAVGATDEGMKRLRAYSAARLLGEHVPYPIEAWPEGNQRHLSAESALYCRVFTEGVFGIRPTGFSSFQATPRLPKEWSKMALRRIGAFGVRFDLTVERLDGGKLALETITEQGTKSRIEFEEGATIDVDLKK